VRESRAAIAALSSLTWENGSVPKRRLSIALAAGFTSWALVRATAADRLPAIDAPAADFLPFTPQAAAAAWISALLIRHKRASAATALAAAALTAMLAPRAIPRRQPPASGPELRVLTANLLAGQADAGSVVELVRRTRADVFFVQELSDEAAVRLSRAGLDELLPHTLTDLISPEPRGNAIYARHPLSASTLALPTSSVQPAAMLKLPAGPVRVVCVHMHTPKRAWRSRSDRSSWRDDLSALSELPLPAWPGDLPVILAGDFNSTIDHAGFRRQLRRGLADAACQSGRGLVPTWGPLAGGLGALLTLDHILVDARCAVESTSVYRLPGSDHRAVFARVRLPSVPAGRDGDHA
jgi:endonuclease/exonuclease/phosphatase family metal-dependent hydrolase